MQRFVSLHVLPLRFTFVFFRGFTPLSYSPELISNFNEIMCVCASAWNEVQCDIQAACESEFSVQCVHMNPKNNSFVRTSGWSNCRDGSINPEIEKRKPV